MYQKKFASNRKVAAIAIAALFCLGVLTEATSVTAKEPSQSEAAVDQSEELIKWEHNLDGALKKAKKSKKLVLVDVYTDWCGWCKVLDKKTYGDEKAAAYINKSFISLKANAEKGDGLKVAEKYNVKVFPTTLVLKASGKKVGLFSGFLPPDKFIDKLDELKSSK